MKYFAIAPILALVLVSCGEPKKSEDLTTERTADAKALMTVIVSTVAGCDSYDAKMAEASDAKDVLKIYQVAKAGEEVCDQATNLIGQIPVPKSFSAKGTKALKEGLSDLATSYSVKAYKFSLFGKIANGDTRPSTLTALQDTAQGLPSRIMVNMAKIYTVFSEEGVDVSSLASDESLSSS